MESIPQHLLRWVVMSKKAKKQMKVEELFEEALVPEDNWPYELPGNWVWVKSEYAARWGSGGTPSRKHSEYYGGSIPWIKTGDLNDNVINSVNEYITDEGLKKSSAKLFPKGSVAIAMYGATIGKMGILDFDASTNQACAVAIPLKNSSTKFLFYYFKLQRQKLINMGKGGAQPNISQTIIKNYPFPLPPHEEQKRIVDKVERLLNKIEEAKQLIDEAKKKFELRRAAILDKAFRGELTDSIQQNGLLEPTGNSPYPLPNGWKWVALDRVVNFENGDRSSAYPKTNELVNEGIPFLSTRELKGGIIQINEETKHISEEKYKSLRSGKVVDNDILMSIRGSVGKIGLFKNTREYNSAFINAQLVILRCEPSILPEFLMDYFATHTFKSLLEPRITGSAQPQLSVKALKEVICPLPPLSEQKKIINSTKVILHKMEEESTILNAIDFVNLKSNILSKAFRGELGTNEPIEESAIELLKEVLQEQIE